MMEGREAFEILRQEMTRGFDQINARLDKMNGSVLRNSEDIAVLKQRVDTRDRVSEECRFECRADIDQLNEIAKATTIDTATRKRIYALLGATAGLAATLTTVLVEIFQWLTAK